MSPCCWGTMSLDVYFSMFIPQLSLASSAEDSPVIVVSTGENERATLVSVNVRVIASRLIVVVS
jgi:hypothetical protein